MTDGDQLGRRGLLARQWVLVGVGVVLPTMIAAAIAFRSLHELEIQLLEERALLAGSEADHVSDHLKLRLEPFFALAALPAADPSGADAGRVTDSLRDAWRSSRLLAGGFILDERGTVLWSDPRDVLAGIDIGMIPGATASLAAGRVVVTGALEPPARERICLLLAPLRGPDGEVRAVAGGILVPGRLPFTQLLTASPPGLGGSVDLVDGNGFVLGSTDPSRVLRPLDHLDVYRRAAARKLPSALRCDLPHGRDGGPEIFSLAPVKNTSWSVVIGQSERHALGPLRRNTAFLAWILPAVALLGIGLAWGVARSLLDPLRRLTTAAEEIAAGNLSRPIPPFPEDEVGHLGRSLEMMRIALKTSLDEITRTNEALEARVADRTAELRRLYRQLQDREEARGALLQKVIRAQEEERKRLARELHDETCQAVAALRMGLETTQNSEQDGAVKGRLSDLEALARRTLDDLHRLIFDLRPSVLDDLGLFPAIRWLGGRHLAPRGIAVRYEFEGEEGPRLSPVVETALFRAVQEAITNIVRHAGAETVLVQASLGPSEVRVEIEDDGAGFDPGAVAEPQESGRGLGLLGMRERIDLVGGVTTIESSPGSGTRVVLSVPLGPAAGPLGGKGA